MTNGPAPWARAVRHRAAPQPPGAGSVVGVTLLAQVHRLLQRLAGLGGFFTHVLVLTNCPVTHRNSVVCRFSERPGVREALGPATHAGSPRRAGWLPELAAAGDEYDLPEHVFEITWTSK